MCGLVYHNWLAVQCGEILAQYLASEVTMFEIDKHVGEY